MSEENTVVEAPEALVVEGVTTEELNAIMKQPDFLDSKQHIVGVLEEAGLTLSEEVLIAKMIEGDKAYSLMKETILNVEQSDDLFKNLANNPAELNPVLLPYVMGFAMELDGLKDHIGQVIAARTVTFCYIEALKQNKG
jgi:hypothetical protein